MVLMVIVIVSEVASNCDGLIVSADLISEIFSFISTPFIVLCGRPLFSLSCVVQSERFGFIPSTYVFSKRTQNKCSSHKVLLNTFGTNLSHLHLYQVNTLASTLCSLETRNMSLLVNPQLGFSMYSKLFTNLYPNIRQQQ